MSDEAVCRTAPATPGLLNTVVTKNADHYFRGTCKATTSLLTSRTDLEWTPGELALTV